jgi:hypothetical protein
LGSIDTIMSQATICNKQKNDRQSGYNQVYRKLVFLSRYAFFPRKSILFQRPPSDDAIFICFMNFLKTYKNIPIKSE